MKATLEFNLPEEKKAYESAVQGSGYREVLRDISNWISEMQEQNMKAVSLDMLEREIKRQLLQKEVKIWG